MTMSVNELETLNYYMGRCVNYLEYGAGASTIKASQFDNIEYISSVESDKNYTDNHVLKFGNVEEREKNGSLKFYHVDIGKTGEWGNPVDDLNKHLWVNYYNAPKVDSHDFDLVLVDGRFRVACALTAIMDNPDAILLIHDFPNRPQYYVVGKFTDTLKVSDTLVVMKRRPDVDLDDLLTTIEQYKYDKR